MKVAALFLVAMALLAFCASVFAHWFPPLWFPHLGTLAVIAFANRRGGLTSLLVVWGSGAIFDTLSSAPLGYHPFLFAITWAATRIAAHQVDLRPNAIFVLFVFSAIIGQTLLSALLFGVPRAGFAFLLPLLGYAALNALVAPALRHVLWAALGRFESEEARDGRSLAAGMVFP